MPPKFTNDDDGDDDDIQVLDPLEVNTLLCAPVTVMQPGNNATSAPPDGNDDIELVGTKNHVLLPHMHQHCTEKSFQGNTGYSTAARNPSIPVRTSHSYVCDVPARDANTWKCT
jgi:hypothetical protein